MKTLIRVEYSSGQGLFNATNGKKEAIIDSMSCYESLSCKHWKFPSPWDDSLLGEISEEEFCAFKSIE